MAKTVHLIKNETALYCGARFHFTQDGVAIIRSTGAVARVMWPYQLKPNMIAKPCTQCMLRYNKEIRK